MELRDKVIVITGASSGFGEAIARRCAAAGATVILAARSAAPLDRLAAELNTGPGRAIAIPTDITRIEDVRHLADTTYARFGRTDILINNAGFGILDRIATAHWSDLQGMMDVNLYGAVHCTQAFLPDMLRRRNGQVLFMASLAGLVASFNMGFYTATKFALVGMARTLMLELIGSGVACVLICPGIADTGFQRRADIRKYSRITKIARVSTEQVAQATLRAILRGRSHEMVVPWSLRPLMVISTLFPGIARAVMGAIR